MRYLFYIAKQYSIPIIQPLVGFLDDSGDEYALFISAKVKQAIGKNWPGLELITDVDEAIAYQPDFVITPGNFIDHRIPGRKVQIFHGLGIEKKSHFKIRHFFDVYLTSGPVVTERFNQLQSKYRNFLVRETGWSKVDYILDYKNSDIREQYGIEKNKKIILYAPTFSRKMESASDLLQYIPDVVKDDEVWLIKFHELMKKELKQQIAGTNEDKIRLIDTTDITPLLHLADCLISDTSSVLYEFLLLNKPVVTYRTLSRQEKGINILDKSELRPALDRALEHGVTAENIKCLHEVNPYVDGNISRNIFRELQNIKQNNLWPQKRKFLNLFRKMQILYHEKYKKGYLR